MRLRPDRLQEVTLEDDDMMDRTQVVVEPGVQQHSIVRSIVLHLLPGVLILVFFVIAAPLLNGLGTPSFLALLLAIAFVLIPFELGYLLYQGKQKHGVLSLRGIVLYRQPVPWWQYIVLAIPLFLWTGLVMMALSPAIDTFFIDSLFPWLPDGDLVHKSPGGRFSLPQPADGACTSFCLDNGGQAVFGSNYDNPIWEGLLFVNKRGVTKTGWEAGTTGKYARWTAEHGSVTFSVSGAQMAWAGMNEAGLAISTMALNGTHHPAPDERPPLFSPLWIQYQLDTCATLEEVMANDSRVRIADTVDHYLVCDRSGACATVEFLDGKTVFHTGEAMPVEALANTPYSRSVDAWQAGRLSGDSLKRFGIAADRVTGFQPMDAPSAVAYAFETLEQASAQAVGSVGITSWSIVFDTENLRVHFRTYRSPQVRYVDFARLDFDCDTPVEMLDVNAPLAGDISDKLDRYSFDANFESTLNYLQKLRGDEVSAFGEEVMIRGIESFGCERTSLEYQEEQKRLLPPVAGWVVLALFHRYWPVGVVLLLGVAVLVGWRVRARRQRKASQVSN
jgi:penicillin V acylase-like amidase (Ntn superfamily)